MSKLILWFYEVSSPITLSFDETYSSEKSEKLVKYLFENTSNKFELKIINTGNDYFTFSNKNLAAVYLSNNDEKIGSKLTIWLRNIFSPIIIYTNEYLSDVHKLKQISTDLMVPDINNKNRSLKIISLNNSCFAVRQHDLKCMSVSFQKPKVELFENESKVELPFVDEKEKTLIKLEEFIGIEEDEDLDCEQIDNTQYSDTIPIRIVFDEEIFL